MYERLSDRYCIPTIEYFIFHIGTSRELFENIHNFLINELNAVEKLGFSRDSNVRGWGLGYKNKTKFFGSIIAENDSFTVVMRLTDEQIKKSYKVVLPYAQEHLDSYHKTSNGGWVQCRVLNMEQLDDVKKILRIRNE